MSVYHTYTRAIFDPEARPAVKHIDGQTMKFNLVTGLGLPQTMEVELIDRQFRCDGMYDHRDYALGCTVPSGELVLLWSKQGTDAWKPSYWQEQIYFKPREPEDVL